MTSPTSAHTDRRPPRRGRGGGFTLIELLVVVGIIVVLLGLVTPAVLKAWRSAQRARTANDLQAIAIALEAYKKDFGDYPRVRTTPPITPAPDRPNPPTGAQILCLALMGPAPATEATPPPGQRPIQDGLEGPGFRVRPNGKTYPPYLPLERFKYGDPSVAGMPSSNVAQALKFCLLDENSLPILYFPASPARPNLRQAPGASQPAPYCDKSTSPLISSEAALWDADDNLIWFHTNPWALSTPVDAAVALRRMRFMLGDTHGAVAGSAPDGVMQADENPVEQPFILWAAGPDERFGPEAMANVLIPSAAELNAERSLFRACDDVTSFGFNQ